MLSRTMLTNCQNLLHNLPEAVLLLDKDGYIDYANEAITTITGYASSELTQKNIALLYKDNDSIKSEFELRQAFKKGRYVSEGWKFRKDGTHFWSDMLIAPLHNEQGQFIGYTCLLQDVSERKQNEIALRHSEERYRLMIEGVRDYAIFMLDPKGYILTWNEGAKRTKGYTSNEIIGKHFSIFYTAPDLEIKKPEWELEIAIETGKYEELGWRVKKNGSIFWANVVITALFNENNKLIGFSKVTRDLTERRENEEELRQSEELYRSLVEQVADYGIFMMDEKGRIISWNEGAKRIKGYAAQEIIGKNFSIFYTEEDVLNSKPAHELQIARTEGKYEEEGWRIRKDGTPFWASIVITAVYNNAGILIGYSKVTRDLTERKEAEIALRESNDNYRRLADELKATNAQLSYANEELEQFTSIVSHDLQEPVRSLKSFLTLIDMKLDEHQTENLKTYITKSINAANRMRELIQNLLQYSQLSRNEKIIEPIDVNELLNQALQNVRTAIEASHAQITIGNVVDRIYGDKVQLVQLFQNLLSNALKFTTSETPQVSIRSTRENGHVRFAISDNGIGIAEGELHKVFEIFRRLHTEKVYPGTGIGLAICKKIVERHGGHIWPESVQGKGTTFYFTINDEARGLQTKN